METDGRGRMTWVDLIRGRIWRNLRHSLPAERARQVLAEEMDAVIAASEAGLPFGAHESPSPRRNPMQESQPEPKPEPRRISSLDKQRAEILAKQAAESEQKRAADKLHREIRRWAGWEERA
jgi:hypothetical protein